MNIEKKELNNENNIIKEFQKIIELAKLNTDEAWEKVDKLLSEFEYYNYQDVIDWARKNITNKDSALSDLAATIFQKTNEKLNNEDINSLALLMCSCNEENPYPSFRAACALVEKSNNEFLIKHKQEIKNKLEIFTRDKDENIAGMARLYIGKLSKIVAVFDISDNKRTKRKRK